MNTKLEKKTKLNKWFQVARMVKNFDSATMELLLAGNPDFTLWAARNKYIGGFCVLLQYNGHSYNLAGWSSDETNKPTVDGIIAIAESYIKTVMAKTNFAL